MSHRLTCGCPHHRPDFIVDKNACTTRQCIQYVCFYLATKKEDPQALSDIQTLLVQTVPSKHKQPS